jgi:hypothetical protein
MYDVTAPRIQWQSFHLVRSVFIDKALADLFARGMALLPLAAE